MKLCPACGKLGMFAWSLNSCETARACQMCGHVEEKHTAVASGVAVSGTVAGVGGPQ